MTGVKVSQLGEVTFAHNMPMTLRSLSSVMNKSLPPTLAPTSYAERNNICQTLRTLLKTAEKQLHHIDIKKANTNVWQETAASAKVFYVITTVSSHTRQIPGTKKPVIPED